jgi:succinate dehydrogenase/fumarate reductase cytochrome b subunit
VVQVDGPLVCILAGPSEFGVAHCAHLFSNVGQSRHIASYSCINNLNNAQKEPDMMNFGYNGLIGVLVLAGDIWAILNILQSSVSNEKKLIWIIAVVLLPVLGLLLWFFLGPRNGRSG